MKFKFALLGLAFMLIVSGLVVVIPNQVSAVTTETWNQTSGNLASTDANWLDGTAPATGTDTYIVFDSTSVADCTWDLAISIGNFSILTGYTGEVTVGASFEITSFYQIDGTLTGSASYILTSSGNVYHGASAVMSGQYLRLLMTGDSSTLTGNGVYRLLGLQISADVTVTHSTTTVNLAYAGTAYLTVDSGKTLTIASGKILECYLTATFTFSNLGSIAGYGNLRLRPFGTSPTIILGVVNSPVEMWISTAEASRTLSLGANTVLGGDLDMWSSHATNTITLSHGANYNLTVEGGISLSARVVLTQGTGTWTFGSYLQNGDDSLFSQGGPVTINGPLIHTDGILTGNADYILTCYGDITHSDYANVTTHVLRLRMMGDDSILTGNGDYRLMGLQISADVTVTHSNTTVRLAYIGEPYLIVDIGKVLTIADEKDLYIYLLETTTFSNLGSIMGYGNLSLRPHETDKIISFGVIASNVRVLIGVNEAANRTLSLGADSFLNSNLSLWSSDLDNDIILSHGNNFTLSVTGMVSVSAHVVITQGTGTWRFGSYDQYGLSSVLNQGGDLEISDTFTQSHGVINSIPGYTITIGSNWSSSDSFVENMAVNGTTYLSLGSGAITASMGTYYEVEGETNFSGPANVMIEAENGDYLAFVREGESHVGVGDYATMNLYRSTNKGANWVYEATIKNVPNRDVRGYSAGMTDTGRLIVFYSSYDVGNSSFNPFEYMYSDDNGTTWGGETVMSIPDMGGVPMTISMAYGVMREIDDGKFGMTYYGGNYSEDIYQVRFAYTSDNGLTWNHSDIGPSTVRPYKLTETDFVHIGDSRLIALARTDGYNDSRMFTSVDNGLTWEDRGYGVYHSIRPPTLITLLDDYGQMWVFCALAYGSTIFYSIANAEVLMDEGVEAWPYGAWLSSYDDGGAYASIVMDGTTGNGILMANYQHDFYNSTNRFYNLTLRVNCTSATIGNLTVNDGCIAELEARAWNLNYTVLGQVINYGGIIQNDKRLNITGSNTMPLIGYGIFDGDIYLNGSVAASYQVELGLPMGRLYSDRTTTINLDAIHSVKMAPSGGTFVGISITSLYLWNVTSEDEVSTTYTVSGLSGYLGYKVYQDSELIATGMGPTFSFTAIGGGDFEIEVWYSKQVSSLIVLTVNLIGMGILISIIGGFIVPLTRDIQAGREVKSHRMIRDLIKTVVFIVIGLLMWGLLHTIAIG